MREGVCLCGRTPFLYLEIEMPIANKKIASGLWPTQVELSGNSGALLTANNTTQGTATLVANEYNEFGTVALNGAAILPTQAQVGGLVPGDEIWIANFGANPLVVFPQVGGTINSLAANASLNVAVKTYTIFVWTASGTWLTK